MPLHAPYTPEGFLSYTGKPFAKKQSFWPYTPLHAPCCCMPLHALTRPLLARGFTTTNCCWGKLFFGNKLTTHTNHKHYVANKKHHRTTKHMIVTIVARLGLM